ncbi:nuclear transport factor 2 family protein [Hydrotalea sp.]|uniref:nuclear transport factor 2 family protein n=1 Tax=Hydrotalea sp. TaxID=2881279 RepID=UPI003D146101
MTLCKIVFAILVVFVFGACSHSYKMQFALTKNYTPDDKALYDTIFHLDSLFFSHYNQCTTELPQYANFYDDSIEFYHDKSGLSTSKKAIVEATQKNICGKVTRELVKGSMEVYPIPHFGAIEIGLHIFHNNQEPLPKHPNQSRYTIIWKKYPNAWKIYRVISLH